MKDYYSIILKNVEITQSGKKLLNNISFILEAGQHLAIFGASGSGKSLLAKALKGDLFHAGTVEYINNKTISTPTIAFVPAVHQLKNLSNVSDFYYQQRFNTCDANDSLTLREELLKNGTEVLVNDWLNTFQLNHRANTPLIQLSNGELKKMQLISHLVHKPNILILDRVFTGLDINSRKVLHSVLNKLAANGTTIILIADSHELPACITRFAEMAAGSVVNYAPIDQLGFLQPVQQRGFNKPLPVLKKAYHVGPLIAMKDVTIRYGSNTILNNINWKVNNGECWLIKGHNGAGKSTLLSLINGDNPQAYSQQIHLFGKKRGTGESIWDIKKKIGFVSPELQNFFDKSSTIFHAVGSGFFDTIGLFKKLSEEQTHKVNSWLDYFGLTDKAQQCLSSLPGGEQRLVLIARALVKDPLLLTMDEPCQGLDEHQTKMIIDLTDKIHKDTGMSVLFISHYHSEIPQCIKHVLELNKGNATLYKKADPSKKSPLHNYNTIKAAIA